MRSLGKRSMMARVIGVRSRITQTMSNGCRRSTTASGVGEMVVKYGDGRPLIQHRPVRERKSDVLVVVKDGDSEAFWLGRHRVSPEGCPFATTPNGRLPSDMPCRV